VSTGSYRPASKSSQKPPPADAPKVQYVPLVLKTITSDGKWRIHGYLNVKPDLSGGVGTLKLPDGTKLEKVNVFPNPRKHKKDAKDSDGQ
jgi:hypothetical protein